MNADIFRAYDIRGLYPSDLNEETAYKIGAALANKITINRKAVVAMDGRLSGPYIKKSLIDGLVSHGIEVTDCGMLPTPMLYFATKILNIPNGFMVTGSHNPKDYNGIKMIVGDNPLFDKDIYALRDWIANNTIEEVCNSDKPNISSDIADKYIKRIKEDISINLEDKFVIDCMNGITGSVIEKVTRAFNINAEFINSAVDGNYPNCDPDPTKESNLEMLKEKIIETNAEYGVAFDGDGDRLVIIKKNGDIIWPDQLMILFSKSILANNQNAKIVYDVKCTKNLKKTIEDSNGIPIESRTGHSYIKQTIKKESAKLGGEMSGHIFFNDKWYGFDDGIYVFLRFLEILSNEPNLVDHLSSLPKTFSTSEIDIEFPGNDHFEFMESFRANSDFHNYSVSYLDGIKISNTDSWGLIRASNTSPKITLRFESLSESSLNIIKNEIKNAILKIDNTIELPFWIMNKEIVLRKDTANIPSTADVLIEALPYIQKLSNKIIVIKFGGNAMIDDKLKNSFARDIVLLKQVGLHPVIVHGGGPQITSYLEKMGIKSEFVDGMRVTDEKSIDLIEMVLGGSINKEIVNLITSHGGRAVGLSGKDGGLIRAKKMVSEGKNKNFDFKNTGMVASIDPSVVNLLDSTSFIPVIAPIGIGDDYKTYNINADIVAGKIAKILQAGKYVMLTNTAGVFDDDGNLIKSMNAEQVRQFVKKGTISSGMLPKVESALEAVSAGVHNVQIIDGTIEHALLLELFTDEGVGTMIRRT